MYIYATAAAVTNPRPPCFEISKLWEEGVETLQSEARNAFLACHYSVILLHIKFGRSATIGFPGVNEGSCLVRQVALGPAPTGCAL